jgi:predicted membrane protein
MFPMTVMALVVAAFILAVWFAARTAAIVELIRSASSFGYAIRAFWLFVAVGGLVALIRDCTDIAAIA